MLLFKERFKKKILVRSEIGKCELRFVVIEKGFL